MSAFPPACNIAHARLIGRKQAEIVGQKKPPPSTSSGGERCISYGGQQEKGLPEAVMKGNSRSLPIATKQIMMRKRNIEEIRCESGCSAKNSMDFVRGGLFKGGISGPAICGGMGGKSIIPTLNALLGQSQ